MVVGCVVELVALASDTVDAVAAAVVGYRNAVAVLIAVPIAELVVQLLLLLAGLTLLPAPPLFLILALPVSTLSRLKKILQTS